ncbi:unnamed protein product [Cochlearia groenlandica]
MRICYGQSTGRLYQGGRVQWDEANIEEIESNKPVRQKITEPKTPYHPMFVDDDDEGSLPPRVSSFDNCVDEMHRAEELSNFMNDVASSSKNTSHGSESGGWSSSDDDTDPVDENEDSKSGKNASFKEHRRAHYDEFRMVKELRSSGSDYGEDTEIEDGAKTGDPEATVSHENHVIKGVNNETTNGAAVSSGKSSSSSS